MLGPFSFITGFMKNWIILCILLCLTACGGVGTERRDKGPKTAAQIQAEIVKNKSCPDAVEVSLEGIAETCAADLNVDLNRLDCITDAQSFIGENPSFVCALEDGTIIDADYVEKNFISGVQTERDKIEATGIFDD